MQGKRQRSQVFPVRRDQLFLPEQNVECAESSVALPGSHIGDDAFPVTAGKPLDNGGLESRAKRRAKTSPVDDLDASKPFPERIFQKGLDFRFSFENGAAVEVQKT